MYITHIKVGHASKLMLASKQNVIEGVFSDNTKTHTNPHWVNGSYDEGGISFIS